MWQSGAFSAAQSVNNDYGLQVPRSHFAFAYPVRRVGTSSPAPSNQGNRRDNLSTRTGHGPSCPYMGNPIPLTY